VSIAESIEEEQRQSRVGRVTNIENPRTRQIEPQQNWLARLFHVKPAMMFICFSVSRRRARQEIAKLLKEWRKYGARDIVVEKERNIIFGRVGPQNCKSLLARVLFALQCDTDFCDRLSNEGGCICERNSHRYRARQKVPSQYRSFHARERSSQ